MEQVENHFPTLGFIRLGLRFRLRRRRHREFQYLFTLRTATFHNR